MTLLSGRPRPTRHILLFVLAIALPCSVLILLTVRMLVQDRELEQRRLVDERRRLAAGVREQLLGHAERLRLAASDPRRDRLVAEVVAALPVVDGRLSLPWEGQPAGAASLNAEAFQGALRAAERLEFADRQFAAAAAAYVRVANEVSDPLQRASATLHAARAFGKAGRRADATRAAHQLLSVPASSVDDQHIPFALYGARLLASAPPTAESATTRERLQDIAQVPLLSPEALFMALDVANQLPGAELVGQQLSRRIRDVEQLRQLAADLPTLGISASTVGNPTWASYGMGDNLWLVHLSSQSEGAPVLTAIRAAAVMGDVPEGTTVAPASGGETLAPSFPGLALSISPATLAGLSTVTRFRQPVYIAALLVIVGVTCCGAYLFWRDVRREVHIADMRSQFVSSVSHELKTPLTAIRMFAETLLISGHRRPELQREYLETIVNESERLSRLLNNVLDFTTIESGRKTYQPRPIALSAVVDSAAKAMQYPFAQQGFDLRVRIDDDVPKVSADADAVQQALLNLLNNALKYSGDGRVIDLSLSRERDDAVIAVTDRGIGIPRDEQTRIFEKFYRVAGASERITGTGLGLTLVDHVVRAHGGVVTVDSAPGEGSTFTIRLPLLPAGQHVDQALVAGRTV